ncbi:MAG TPA: GrlR family regulatory protein [Xanthobacteraceae bacterium]|nr:GrlR family regulatory protein [Xanthobacteraceae bacterium]
MNNGLYSIHVDLLDGNSGRGSGVLVFQDGKIRGGDGMLFYIGSYSVKENTVKGEVFVKQHSRNPDVAPLFGGADVSIGFSGQFSADAAKLNGSAFFGRTTQLFEASLRKLAD